MKIAYTGLDLPEGKVKYNDAILADLEAMFKPDKVSPFYFELLPDGFDGFRTLVERGGALWFISLQLSILPPSCRRVCGGGRSFHYVSADGLV